MNLVTAPRAWRRCSWAVPLLLSVGALILAVPSASAFFGGSRRALRVDGSAAAIISEAQSSTSQGEAIPGSRFWVSCGKHMEQCGHYCCCLVGYEFQRNDSACHHPINDFNDKLDSALFEAQRGLYYAFGTAAGELVASGDVQSVLGGTAAANSSFPLASASKLYTAFAAMVTMQLKPRDFHPEKHVHDFKGWEQFRHFKVHNSGARADLKIRHLLTHTSGLPFAMRNSKADIQKLTLFFEPGTKFGYTLGHRVVGWILRDFWKEQREGKRAGIKTVQDTFKFLIFDKLGLSNKTKFDPTFELEFGTSGQAGDAALASTGEDMMKLAVVALRKGRLPDGTVLISEENWNKWAVPNLLPGGRLTKDLVDWQVLASSWADWNVAGLKGSIMRQSGDYGWNYFGATYYDSKEIGWCGFFSSCLRVSYPQGLAAVMMQRDVADLKRSKPYLVEHFDHMAESLQCRRQTCGSQTGSPVFCQRCEEGSCHNSQWTTSCPVHTKRFSSLLTTDSSVDPTHITCYVRSCSR